MNNNQIKVLEILLTAPKEHPFDNIAYFCDYGFKDTFVYKEYKSLNKEEEIEVIREYLNIISDSKYKYIIKDLSHIECTQAEQKEIKKVIEILKIKEDCK